MLFSLHRGLFATAPVFLLTPVGLWLLWRDHRRLAVTLGAAIAVGTLVAMGADVWYAGWSFGPRLLVPVMGLAMVPVAAALARLPQLGSSWRVGLAWGAVAVGILYYQLVHAVFPELPEDALNPLRDVIVPMLARDELSPNVVSTVTGARGPWTLAPLVVGVLAVLVWTARALHGRGRSARAWLTWALGALLVPALFATYVTLQPPGWSKQQHAAWAKVVAHWERVESER